MSSSNEPRIVIRKKRVSHEGGHSGGAWKIAYADFMTAMMAFFLVMWILSLVPKSELKDLADYFRRPLISAITGDPNLPASRNLIPGGTPTPIPNRAALPDTSHLIPQHSRGDNESRDRARLENLKNQVNQLIEQKPDLKPYQPQMLMDMTSEGLRIQILDDQKRPMFATGSARLHPEMLFVLRELSPLINEMPNGISISGHTDATQYVTGEFAYSNWELSADRANSARQALVNGGLEESKVRRIQGLASTINLVKDDPYAPINRRISIVVLNEEAEAELNRLNAVPGLSQDEIDERLKQAKERSADRGQHNLGYTPRESAPVISSMYPLDASENISPALGNIGIASVKAVPAETAPVQNILADTAVAVTEKVPLKTAILMVNGLEKNTALAEHVFDPGSYEAVASGDEVFDLPATADTIFGSVMKSAVASIESLAPPSLNPANGANGYKGVRGYHSTIEVPSIQPVVTAGAAETKEVAKVETPRPVEEKPLSVRQVPMLNREIKAAHKAGDKAPQGPEKTDAVVQQKPEKPQKAVAVPAKKTDLAEKSKKIAKPAVNKGKKANESANTRSAAPEKARASAKVDKKASASTARKATVAPVKAFTSDRALPLDQAVPLDRVMRLNQPVIVESVKKVKRPSVAKERSQTEAVVSKPSTRAIEVGSDLGRILRNNFYQ